MTAVSICAVVLFFAAEHVPTARWKYPASSMPDPMNEISGSVRAEAHGPCRYVPPLLHNGRWKENEWVPEVDDFIS